MPTILRCRPHARFVGWLVLCAAMSAPAVTHAQRGVPQLPQTRLYAVHPSGGQRGTNVEITLADGYDFDEADRLYFSHPGITAAPKMQTVEGKTEPAPGQFVVSIGAEVPVGVYDVRVHGRYGLSNPRTFSVGDLREILETEPNNTPEQATALPLETLVNGRSDGNADIDWYKVSLKSGQRILASLQSRRIDSRMDGALEIHQGGRRLAHQRFRGRTEPLIDFVAPADGDYLIKVHDFVYGGGADFIYRLAVHTGPYVEFMLPASGQPNATGQFTLYGRNIPGGQPSPFQASDGRKLEQLTMQIATVADPASLLPADQIAPQEAGVDGASFALTTPSGTSNPTTIYFASAPTALEAEPNDTPEQAQKIVPPVEITGQFQAIRDLDLYEFEAKSGTVYWIELFGQRNGTAADPVLIVEQVKKDDKGVTSVARLTTLDDNPLNIGGAQFNTTSDDPVYRFAAPADGTYRVIVRDRSFENRGDPSLVYRLAIRKERPDFRLVALSIYPTADPNMQQNTWEPALLKGDNSDLSVMVFRRDGYAGPIEVTAEGLPAGVTCTGTVIAGNQNIARLVLSSTEQAPEWSGTIRIVGKARIDDAAAVAAETAAIAARTAAVTAWQPLAKAAADAAAALKKATDQAAAAKEALDKAPEDAAAQKAKADADAAVAKADAAAKAAVEARAPADAKLADANGAVAAARAARRQTAREVIHEARSGTIVWNGNPGAQQPAHARLARSVTLSVVRDAAPYQLLTDVTRVSVNQGSQVLIPYKLLKRAGFDNNVNLTFVTPPPNMQVENKPIAKGVSEQVYRVYVQNNAPVGTHTLFIQSQGQFSYTKNPEAAAVAAKERDTADKTAAEAAELAKKAVEAKAAAEKKLTDAVAAAKKATEAKPIAEKLVVDTAAAQKAAADQKAAAEKAAIDTASIVKAATDEKTKADKIATDAAGAAKAAADEKARIDKLTVDTSAAAKAAADAAAAAKMELEKDPANEALKKASADADAAAAKAADEAKKAADAKPGADKAATDTAEAAKKAAEAQAVVVKNVAVATDAAGKATAAKTAADKAAADADDAAKKAVEGKAAAEKAIVDTEAATKAATEEKAAAEKRVPETDQQSKNAAAKKAAAGKKATDTANVAKPQNINTFFPAPPLIIEVKPSPGTLAVAPANGGAVKRGASLEVKCTVTRANGFNGPVTLSLPLPPGVSGITAPEVVIPADGNEAVLVIQAGPEATMGALANLAVRASMEFDGPASIDQPLGVNVQQ